MIKGCVFYSCVGVYLSMYVYCLYLLFCYSFYYLFYLLLLYRDVFMRAILLTMEFTMSKPKTGLYAMRAIAVYAHDTGRESTLPLNPFSRIPLPY